MTAMETVRRISSGERPGRGALPQSCRLEAFGAEAYGEEAIVACFGRAPLIIDSGADLVRSANHFAVFVGSEVALLGDLCGEAVTRMWRLGPGDPLADEPAIAVAFDPDLTQARGDIHFAAEGFRDLAPTAAAHVAAIGRDLELCADAKPRPFRTRTFVVRAFSAGADGAALFAVHRLGGEVARTAGFSYAAARFRVEHGLLVASRIVRDCAGEAAAAGKPWRPHIEG